MKNFLPFCILLVFLLYGLNSEVFERHFFFNELLALCGMVLLFIKSFRQHFRFFIIPRSAVYRLVLAFIGLGLVHLAFSFFIKTNFFYYFRGSVIVYSAFSFFIGFYLLTEFKVFVRFIRNLLRGFMAIALPLGSEKLLDRFSGAVFFPFLFRSPNTWSFLVLVALNFYYAKRFESLTVILIALLLSVIFFIRRFVHFKVLALLGFSAFVALFIYLMPTLDLYKKDKYKLFGDVHAPIRAEPLLQIDVNSSWRTILWYRVTVDAFPQNVIGLGIGTPLLPYRKGADTAESEHDDEHDAHTTGVHNTYLTLTARLGLLVPVIFFLIYHQVFKEFYGFRKYYRQNGEELVFWAFFNISVIGLFNLVLESPIYASLFWILLGLTARAIFNRKNADPSAILKPDSE